MIWHKKSLQDWYNGNNISYNEKERLNKIGIGNYDYHYYRRFETNIKMWKLSQKW